MLFSTVNVSRSMKSKIILIFFFLTKTLGSSKLRVCKWEHTVAGTNAKIFD